MSLQFASVVLPPQSQRFTGLATRGSHRWPLRTCWGQVVFRVLFEYQSCFWCSFFGGSFSDSSSFRIQAFLYCAIARLISWLRRMEEVVYSMYSWSSCYISHYQVTRNSISLAFYMASGPPLLNPSCIERSSKGGRVLGPGRKWASKAVGCEVLVFYV